MASVCKWLGFYLCMRQDTHPKLPRPTDLACGKSGKVGECNMYDAIIVWKEGPVEKQGGMAYDVILAPSKGDTPKKSPPKERPLSQEIIQKKLKEAEERRLSMEAAKLVAVAKQKERAQEAVKKVEELNDSFAKETEKKLLQKLQTNEEKRQEQYDALQQRLRDHMKRVEEVRKSVMAEYNEDLAEKIESKLSKMQSNRESQIMQVQERLQDHERHIRDVIEQSQKMANEMSKCTEEKVMRKMETTMKNREEQLQSLIEKRKEHVKHVYAVREKAKSVSPTDENALPAIK